MKSNFYIKGKVPSKKNKYRIGNGRMWQDKGVKKWMDAAVLQLYDYRRKMSIKPCGISILFKTDNRSDLDGMVATIFDVLQKAKIVKNDRQFIELTAAKKPMDLKNDYWTDIVVFEL